MKSFVKQYVAVVSIYRLDDDDYRSLEVPHAEWVLMTPEQRKKQINKVVKCKVYEYSPMSQSSSLESVAKLSVAWNDAHITHVQPSRVADLWRKAEEILSTPDFVVAAAGNASARQVASVSSSTSSNSGVTASHCVYSKKSKVGTEVYCGLSSVLKYT